MEDSTPAAHVYRASIDSTRAASLYCSIYNRGMSRITLTLSPEMLEFRSYERSFYALWRDVEAVGPWSGFWSKRVYGEGLWLRPQGPFRIEHPNRFVPLQWFDADWCNGPLGVDIRRYAPWLFAAPTAPDEELQ